jgi:hypothetical protein
VDDINKYVVDINSNRKNHEVLINSTEATTLIFFLDEEKKRNGDQVPVSPKSRELSLQESNKSR